MSEDLAYQVEPQVAQLRAQKATADAYGQTDLVEAADKQLKGLGVVEKAKAAEARAEAADEIVEARSEPPKGRAVRQQQTAEQPA